MRKKLANRTSNYVTIEERCRKTRKKKQKGIFSCLNSFEFFKGPRRVEFGIQKIGARNLLISIVLPHI